MNDPALRSVLKWGLNNSGASNASAENTPDPLRRLNPEALASVLGGPSEADLMVSNLAAAQSEDANLQNRVTALENFEQLIEGIDNANSMDSLKLWTPLVNMLQHEEADVRKMAASCLGTAVQNNVKTQETLTEIGAIPTLVKLTTEDPHEGVRKKAIRAISSLVRNYQPALDCAIKHLPAEYKSEEKPDASDMESIDRVIERLRQNSENIE